MRIKLGTLSNPLERCTLIIHKFDQSSHFRHLTCIFEIVFIWHYSLALFLATPGPGDPGDLGKYVPLLKCILLQISRLFCNLKTRMYLHSKQTKLNNDQICPDLGGSKFWSVNVHCQAGRGFPAGSLSFFLDWPKLDSHKIQFLTPQGALERPAF